MDTELFKWATTQLLQLGTMIAIVGLMGKFFVTQAGLSARCEKLEKDISAAHSKIREIKELSNDLK